MNEIGSEFWECDQWFKMEHWWDNCGIDREFYVSGRTALDAILDDILYENEKELISAYLPSYCCESMILPFYRHHIRVEFYSVAVSEAGFELQYNFNNKHKIVLALEYFGFCDKKIHDLIRKEAIKGKFVIQDVTHSLLQDKPFCEMATYVFASFRKWTFFSGLGIAIKMGGHFFLKNNLRQFTNFNQLRKKAATKKNAYILQGAGNKQEFLSMFSKAEKNLDEKFEGYLANLESKQMAERLAVDKIKSRRKKNAAFLLEGIQQLSGVFTPFAVVNTGDTPLFVPVFVKAKKRNLLRNYLTNKQIYCPIHWLLTEKHIMDDKDKNTYTMEISLVCDQRYNQTDMDRELKTVNDFYEANY